MSEAGLQVIDAAQVRALLDYPYLVDGLARMHREAPPRVERMLMEQGGAQDAENFFLIWQAWRPGAAFGAKLVSGFPGNREGAAGLPTVQALVVLFDGTTGTPRAVIDGTELTYWKTAADSALGASLLARPDAATLLMVGAGAMAPHLIRAHRAVRPSLDRVLLWNRTRARAEELAAGLADEGLAVEVVEDLAAAVPQAEVICCATSARAPLLRGEWLAPGTYLDLVGSFTNEMREADDEAARRARIFVDTRAFTVGQCGDITGPLASGAIDESAILGDLFELCQGRLAGRLHKDDITLFKNAGGGHLDLMVAELILARLAPAR